jgi:hypothetical protein
MSFILHPLLRLTATQPHLLADHAEAYAELVGAQAASALLAWKRRAVFASASLGLALISVLLAGVAVMLWAVTPLDQIHQPIALFAAPILPAAVSIAFWLFARSQKVSGMFDEIRDQMRSDLAMLREAGAT